MKFLKNNSKWLFVFCGVGDDKKMLQEKIEIDSNVLFHDWVSEEEGLAIMDLSTLGFAPYVPNQKCYNMSIPTKIIKYLSKGLPVLSPLKGNLQDLIAQYDCGFYYQGECLNKVKEFLTKIERSENFLNYLSKNSKALYDEKFNSEKVYRDVVLELEEIKKNHHV